MDADELRKTLKRLDAMSERCDYVISRNRPLTLDEPPRRIVRKVVVPDSKRLQSSQFDNARPRPLAGGVATGQLTGNEMRTSGYSPRPSTRDDCDPDGMWANFESEFDDMVAGMH